MSDRDYYEILEIPPEASQEGIDRAYRVLALRYHPDRYPLDSRRQAWAEERFKELQEAHEVLRDPLKRRAYDEDWEEDESFASGSKRPEAEPAESSTDGSHPPREGAEEHLHRAQGHYAKGCRGGFWWILSGARDGHLKAARIYAEKVIREVPNSRLLEEAVLLYLRTLMEADRYDRPYLDWVNSQIERFMRKCPMSRLQQELLYSRARFALFKKDEPRRAAAMFKEFIRLSPGHELVPEAKACLRVAQELLKRRT